MGQEMECMCLECGTYVHISMESTSLEEDIVAHRKVVDNSFCTECGGPLMLIGKAGDEPH